MSESFNDGKNNSEASTRSLDSLYLFVRDQGMLPTPANKFLRKLSSSQTEEERSDHGRSELDMQKMGAYLFSLLAGERGVTSRFALQELNMLVGFRNYMQPTERPLPLFKRRQVVTSELIAQAQRSDLGDVLLEKVLLNDTTERLVTPFSFVLGSAVLGVPPSHLGATPTRFSEVVLKLKPNRPPASLDEGFVGDSDKAYLGTSFDGASGKVQIKWGVRPHAFLQLATDCDDMVGEGAAGRIFRQYTTALRGVVE